MIFVHDWELGSVPLCSMFLLPANQLNEDEHLDHLQRKWIDTFAVLSVTPVRLVR